MMFVFCLLYVYIAIYHVSDGRTLLAMIGGNVSFSFTINDITTDGISILHNNLPFLTVWLAKNIHFVHMDPEKVRVSVNMSEGETIIVTVSILNIKKTNAGLYMVSQQSNSAQINDSIRLQTIEGRTVQAVVGRNVSFSFVFSNITKGGAVFIHHDMSPFFSAWPDNKFHVLHKETEKVRVSVDMSSGERIIVTVHFLNITSSDAGIYTVTQQLDSDKFDYGVRLQVINNTQIPRIAIMRYNLSDSSLVLQCVRDSFYPGNIFWKLNASLIKNIDEYSHNNDYLSISNLTADYQYNSFTCLEEENGLESDPYRLKAHGPTVVSFTPDKTVVMEQENVSCISDCSPVCTYQWTKLGTLSGFETQIYADNALYIFNITRRDAGNYTCNVTNIITGRTYTNIVSLDVVYGPDEILLNASNYIEMDKFDSTVIFCSADCFPPCQIHWSQTTKHLPGADLWLNNLQDSGNFTCHARNVLNIKNSISKTVRIIMKAGTGSNTSNTTTTKEEGYDRDTTERQKYRLLMYLVIGMGAILLTGFSICILQKFVKCACFNQVPANIPNQESGEENPLQANPSGGYWTIVYNTEGDLRTVLETNIDQIYEPTPIANITVVEVDTREVSPQFQRKDVGIEFDGYIHAIHSGPVNSGVMTAGDTT